jgi:hypothetical protein
LFSAASSGKTYGSLYRASGKTITLSLELFCQNFMELGDNGDLLFALKQVA